LAGEFYEAGEGDAMKFCVGVPAWLGAILIVAPPAAVAGIVSGLLQPLVPPWAQFIVGFLCLLLAGIVWFMAILWWEKRCDRKES